MNPLVDQRTLLITAPELVAGRLSEDLRVRAVWLGGSLGRGGGDVLSDIDLVVVCAPNRTEEVAAFLEENLSIVGPVAFVHESPQNAPSEGRQLNVLYNTDPLPVYVDWNVWPPVAVRPSDVSVLFEREPFVSSSETTFASTLDELPRGRGPQRTEAVINHFRVFMTPILAKHAARGWFDSVEKMQGYMHLPTTPIRNLTDAIEFARRILYDFGASETEEAISCMHRYLSLVAEHAE